MIEIVRQLLGLLIFFEALLIFLLVGALVAEAAGVTAPGIFKDPRAVAPRGAAGSTRLLAPPIPPRFITTTPPAAARPGPFATPHPLKIPGAATPSA